MLLAVIFFAILGPLHQLKHFRRHFQVKSHKRIYPAWNWLRRNDRNHTTEPVPILRIGAKSQDFSRCKTFAETKKKHNWKAVRFLPVLHVSACPTLNNIRCFLRQQSTVDTNEMESNFLRKVGDNLSQVCVTKFYVISENN